VIYFSGFCLRGESELFADWLVESDYAVAGFSYGAIRAMEYALESPRRIDRLLLFSPAFFQTRKERFLRMQLDAFRKDPQEYRRTFFRNVAYPAAIDLSAYEAEGSAEELEALLTYRWEEEKIREVTKRGTIVEVFIGEKDRIIDAKGALEFFIPLATATYRFREAGHILCDGELNPLNNV